MSDEVNRFQPWIPGLWLGRSQDVYRLQLQVWVTTRLSWFSNANGFAKENAASRLIGALGVEAPGVETTSLLHADNAKLALSASATLNLASIIIDL